MEPQIHIHRAVNEQKKEEEKVGSDRTIRLGLQWSTDMTPLSWELCEWPASQPCECLKVWNEVQKHMSPDSSLLAATWTPVSTSNPPFILKRKVCSYNWPRQMSKIWWHGRRIREHACHGLFLAVDFTLSAVNVRWLTAVKKQKCSYIIIFPIWAVN